MNFTLQHLYRAFRLAVMFWPGNTSERRMLHSFAVVDQLSKINQDNLGQYAEKKYSEMFFSRKWADLQYNPSEFVFEPPYLIVFEPEGNINITDGFVHNKQYTDYTLWLYVFDAFKDVNHLKDKPYDFLTIEELYLEGERKLMTLFDFLQEDLVFASVDSLPVNIYAREWLAINHPDAVQDDILTDKWPRMLQDVNETITVSRISTGANDLHGVRATMRYRARCHDREEFAYNRNIPDKVIQDHDASPYGPFTEASS